MTDHLVDQWRPRGVVSLWRNKHRDQAWNLTADEEGSAALCELCDRMLRARWPSKRRFALDRPTVTADHGGTKPFAAAAHLTLRHVLGESADAFWELSAENADVSLALGTRRLDEFRAAIVDLSRGGGDYHIGDDASPLWIWWYVEPNRAGR